MKGYRFLDEKGRFLVDGVDENSYLYFPIANEAGVKSSLTPGLGGDWKMDQNSFLLQPFSAEDLHNNKGTRNFWCNFEEKGCWSATGGSARQKSFMFSKEQEECSLEAGVIWHKLYRRSSEFGVSSTILSFVPCGYETFEVMQVTIKNEGSEEKSFIPTAAIPLYARSADNIRDHRHVTSLLHRIETTEAGVVVTPTLTFDERGHKKNDLHYFVYGFMGEGKLPVGFYPVVEDFIGEGGSFEQPKAIFKDMDKVPAFTKLEGYEAMGGIVFERVTIKPEEEVSFHILLGMGNSMEEIEEMTLNYHNARQVEEHWETTKAYWQEKLNIRLHTEDTYYNNYMYWVSFQPMLRRIYGCSFLPHHDYGKGGRGWRDLWQDCLALLLMNPDGVREMLIDNYAGVRIDGTNATIIGTKQGEFIADRNNITRVWMDHGVWPLLTTDFYIQQTGDVQLLMKENTYFKDKQIHRGEKIDENWKIEDGCWQKDISGKVYKGTILEHLLLQHLTTFYDVGEHNHMRLRGADWNDALDMAPDKGESVAFTAAYAGNFHLLANLVRFYQEKTKESSIYLGKEILILLKDEMDLYESIAAKHGVLTEYYGACSPMISGEKVAISCDELIQNLDSKANWLMNHIRKIEWIESNGYAWFNGYYDNNGNPVEGSYLSGVRMMLTSQVFTIMSGTATKEQVGDIVKAADHFLYDKSIGGYRLNTNFHEVKDDLGRMFGFAYGHKENGAVFCHMAVMYANALYKRGFAKEGYKVLNTLYEQSNNYEVSRIYPGIPEYFNEKGRGMYHYLTGAASWLLLTVVTEMFGVKGKEGNLFFEPKLMKEQFDDKGEIGIETMFGGRQLYIRYMNPNKLSYGEYKVTDIQLNGKSLKDSLANGCVPRDVIEALPKEDINKIVVMLF